MKGKIKIIISTVLVLVLVFTFTGIALADSNDYYNMVAITTNYHTDDYISKLAAPDDNYVKDDNTSCTGAGSVYSSHFDNRSNVRVSDVFQIQSGYEAYDYLPSLNAEVRLHFVNAWYPGSALYIKGYQRAY